MDGEGVDAVEAGVVAVSGDLLHLKSGTGKPTPMNTGEKDAAAGMKENTTGVGRLFVVTDSTEGGGGAGDVDKTTIMDRHDPLPIMVPIRSPRRIPLTRLHLSL